MTSPLLAGDWALSSVTKVVDGDTIHANLNGQPQLVTEDLAQLWMTAKPWKLRLIIVDTPERGEPGHLEAKQFVLGWLAANDGAVRVETYYRDNFGRMLSDFYVWGDRANTLTQALLREGYAEYNP